MQYSCIEKDRCEDRNTYNNINKIYWPVTDVCFHPFKGVVMQNPIADVHTYGRNTPETNEHPKEIKLCHKFSSLNSIYLIWKNECLILLITWTSLLRGSASEYDLKISKYVKKNTVVIDLQYQKVYYSRA